MHPTTATTSPTGAAMCAETESEAAPQPHVEPAAQESRAEDRRHWLATAAWPEVAFATA